MTEPRAFGMPKTPWTRLLQAQDPALAGYREAWNSLIEAYWKPVHEYLRATFSLSPDEAADLVQSFFLHQVETNGLRSLVREKGRFHAYLKQAVKHFAINEAEARRAVKRGGRVRHVGGDLPETRRLSVTPEDAFEREWRRAVLQRAEGLLEQELRAEGKEGHWRAFQAFYHDEEKPTYAELAARLGLSVPNLCNRLNEGRRRYRNVLRRVLAETGDTPESFRRT